MILFWILLWGVHIFFTDILLGRAEISNACKNWGKMMGKDIEWTKVFVGIQTKICNRILVTNSVLKDMGAIQNNVWHFCLTEKDTFFYLMCQCEHIQSFWVISAMSLKEKSFNCARFLINPTCLCSAWNYVCAYTHKCLSPVFQCYNDKR